MNRSKQALFQAYSTGELIQAGIYKADGRNYRNYLFIRFRSTAENRLVQELVSTLARKYITSQKQQEQDTLRYKRRRRNDPGDQGAPVVNFGFTYTGFLRLFSKGSPQARTITTDLAFMAGMKESQRVLHDYGLEYKPEAPANDRVDDCWLHGGDYGEFYGLIDEGKKYPFTHPVDMFISIAHDCKQACEFLSDHIARILIQGWQKGVVKAVHLQHGHQRRDDVSHKPVSSLGFQEGFASVDTHRVKEHLLVRENWYDHRVFGRSVPTYGTYLAYRKIEIDRSAWEAKIAQLAKQLQLRDKPSATNQEDKMHLAKAMYMGRFENGTPLALSDRPLDHEHWTLAGRDLPFDYEDDPGGTKCPFGAHVRRMNPYGTGKNTIQIARRGISYREPDGREGLLFVSLQRSIANQFEPLFRRMQTPFAPDAVVYREDPSSVGATSVRHTARTCFRAPRSYASEDLIDGVPIAGRAVTKFKGGEYFYLPSVAFLCLGVQDWN